MNRFIILISVLFFSSSFLYGQLTFSGWSHNHINITTYNGEVDGEGMNLRFEYSGSQLNEPNWKLSVQVLSPFSGGGRIFPADKISLIPVYTTGQANPGPIPTINQIGVPPAITLNESSEVFVVPSSNTPLNNVSQWNSYYNMRMAFDLVVAGGTYLRQLQNATYAGTLRFTAYRQDNSIIGVVDLAYRIQVHRLTGQVPEEYSLSFTSDASNGVLEFNTMQDYMDGKSVTYKGGMIISATTAFQVTVRSLTPNISTPNGNGIPLDVVQMKIGGQSGTTPPVPFSMQSTIVLQGESTNGIPENFDITYTTQGMDQRIFKASPNSYQTKLVFEITPL